MNIIRKDEMKYALVNLWHRKTRSFLTMLSILIGVMAIAALISFGFGIKNYMNDLSQTIGADKLFVQSRGVGAPGTDGSFSLTKDDVEFISKISGVKEVLPWYMKTVEIKYKTQRQYQFINGFDMKQLPLVEETYDIKILKGRSLKNGDYDRVVLGYSYTKEKTLFKRPVNIGDKVLINNKEYEVIGFYDEIGSPQDDANIYVTKGEFENLFPKEKDKFGFVVVKAQKDILINDLKETIAERLRKHLNQDKGKETFFIMTFEDAIKTFGIILNVITGVLVLIALISVIVASVNIMNTMYTAVLERTKEIGIMKAIGARNGDIFFIFVFESGTLGLIGGGIGMLIGYFIAFVGGQIAIASGYPLLQPSFPWYLTVGCLLFSFLVGVAAGFLPSRNAAAQKPVDSLRYE